MGWDRKILEGLDGGILVVVLGRIHQVRYGGGGMMRDEDMGKCRLLWGRL